METYSFRNETELESTVTGIDPGSHCNVSITTHIGSQIGCPLHIELNKTSKETAPNNPVISCLKPGKRSLNVSWNEPTTPNGFVRKYQLLVVDKTSGCLKANHTYCLSSICVDDEDVYQEVSLGDLDKCNGTQYSMKVVHELPREDVVEQLHPYRQYNVTVRAYTKCWGNFTWLNSETESDLPSAAPSIRTLIPTEEGFNISMVPPDEDDRNGVITNYTIRYTWINNTCWDSHDGEIVEETIYTNNESNHEVSNLRPYWYYNITVSASTKVGEGPVGWCDAYYVRTNTSIPGDVRNLTIITTSSNASLTWVTPCETNGIITMYSINITNNDTSTTWENETDGNMTQFVVQNLLPYSNYSFSLAASTEKGIGNRSIDIEKRTDTAKPYQPRNPRADKTYSTRIDVKWDTPDLYTGPTRYFCIPVDDKNKNIKLENSEVHGFKARSCTLTGLDEFWTYSITVTASTDRGNTSATFRVKTAEDKPGKVSYLKIKSEKDVTKQRSVYVVWNEPSIRDRNGIIQNYSIVFTNSSVFANTSAGNGSVVTETVNVQPGAPLRINESEVGQLMTRSDDQPKDTELQIAVKLPLKTFLCNTSNGYPTKWGLVVAQNDQATGIHFCI
ncbi:phosphatidylinositol phosphatase PTPRQ-like [Ruditapes philippinarum]|uniref:phosphatidylinositol phosphatase PTPRQ-like n=1 Tax=Ruditapes philippinarum TaxID=129788 RepID=UPI00295BCA49|nr:phosphatidylinositol phosphatase PTPRQ-like [Ruditapes philippinarum]